MFKATTTFRPKPVVDAVDRAATRVLGKFGAYVRRDARKRIKKRKKGGVSKPGESPVSHNEQLKLILFDVDSRKRSTIIGPIRLRGKQGLATKALEQGGEIRWKGERKGKPVIAKAMIEPRPYMKPAFEALKPKLPEMWRNAITK